MATLVLSAVGASLGSAAGGSLLGVTASVLGRAIGATAGQVIDRALFGQKLLGSGSEVVEQGRVERFRLSGASEGAGIDQIHGRTRVAGQVIWASRFLETTTEETVGGGKGGGGGSTTVRSFSYSVSLAIALCEGEIARVGRIWADGNEISPGDLTLRVYPGSESQLPDPKIEAVEGAGNAPAYRGTAYLVIEDLQLEPFGNRVPQFSFEVVRPELAPVDPLTDLARNVRAVAIVPGTGEYALATTPVYLESGPGQLSAANVNSPAGGTDFKVSVDEMRAELPAHEASSLVVSWFGTDLRCGSCEIRPRVERTDADGQGMPWRVSGIDRGGAGTVPYEDGRPIYGGTPADAAVSEAIAELRAGGRAVMFYPFLLMEQIAGNGLPDPWSDAVDQPALPWRGRITLSVAPGRAGSPDGTATAEAEVAAFFGTAAPGDFAVVNGARSYQGPAEFSYRRFILHYAWLCADAGGVDAFCIGSELRGLTQIRGSAGGFRVVEALRALAADIRTILGPDTKIGYAADWSEYFGYHPDDGSGDVQFHLDPLWADPVIDFIGIDNYMPLADWRDGDDHADAGYGSIYNLDYLTANVAGGEGIDWYYGGPEGREAQLRLPITDGAHGEDWIFRFKDLVSWWSNPHHDRPGGVRSATPTPWVPESKPIWFTEIGCPAVDKGANAPNLFLDPKSSESAIPPYSDGRPDDFMQMQFLLAHVRHWADPLRNPVSGVYGGPMVETGRMFVWAWDARPFPHFPNRGDIWSDGANYARGHWLNGRASSRSLASVVAEICRGAGVTDIDVGRLHGTVRGFRPDPGATARSMLQPLMLAYGFDAVERDGTLVFQTRDGRPGGEVSPEGVVETDEIPGGIERTRAPVAEAVGRARVASVEALGDYQVRATEAGLPDDKVQAASQIDLPLVLTAAEARAVAERWLFEARVARDTLRLALPPSRADLGAGDVMQIAENGGKASYRIDRVEQAGFSILEATRVEPQAYRPAGGDVFEPSGAPGFVAPVPVLPVFLDLPLLTGAEAPHAPHIAVAADPWPGDVNVYRSPSDSGFQLAATLGSAAVVGETLTALPRAGPDLFDRGAALRVRLYGGALFSVAEADLQNGANVAAIGDGIGDDWEVFQFASAGLVGEKTYDLSLRLRGQFGTDGVIPDAWPAGSRFVLLNAALGQPDLPPAARGLDRTWRIGPAKRPVDDPVYVEETRAFHGVGLRPYAPVHLRAAQDPGGDAVLSWVRRTRIDGDSWAGLDVPLGEDREAYLLRVYSGAALVRETELPAPGWVYTAAMRTTDGVTGAYAIEVAQISDRFGPGMFRRIEIDG